MLLIIAIFVIGGAIFAYALTQGDSITGRVVESENVAAACSGGCDGNCGGSCGAADCGCAKKQASTCGSTCAVTNGCAANPGACGNTGCSGSCGR